MGEKKDITDKQREAYRYQARIRAGSKVNRLVRENNLTKMWTLTYAAEQDNRKQTKEDFEKFIKRLSYNLNRKINYVAVIEVQKERAEKTGKQVLHFHLALEGYYIDKDKLEEIWGHGYVFYSKYADGTPIRGKASVAGYLSKYLKKDMEENPELAGQKMYLNSQGLKRPNTGHGYMDNQERNEIRKVSKTFEIKDNLTGYEFDTGALPVKPVNGLLYTDESNVTVS